jgi:hypothetical protein
MLLQDELNFVRKDRRGCIRGATSSEESSRVSIFCLVKLKKVFVFFFCVSHESEAEGTGKSLDFLVSNLFLTNPKLKIFRACI